jgi:hypothetical protein
MFCSIHTGLEAATVVPLASMTRSTAKLSLLVSTLSVAAPPPAGDEGAAGSVNPPQERRLGSDPG